MLITVNFKLAEMQYGLLLKPDRLQDTKAYYLGKFLTS